MNKQKRPSFLPITFTVILITGMIGCEKSQGIVSPDDRLVLDDRLISVTAEVMDMELVHSIKMALAKEDALANADIRVIAKDGAVQLRGLVDNQDQHDRAVAIANGVMGVKLVDDMLAVKEQE